MHDDGADVSAAKQRLRARLLAARRELSHARLAEARAAIRTAALAAAAEHAWRCVAAYRPLRCEPGSRELLAGLDAAGVRVLVPVLLPDRDLDWAPWHPPDDVGGAPLGPDAIADADAVLVPALAVDARGVRLGRGGGSYDRALARVGPGVAVVALLHDTEVLADVPHQAWDVPVGAALTPGGWHRFTCPPGNAVRGGPR